jgi:hypothetical protein
MVVLKVDPHRLAEEAVAALEANDARRGLVRDLATMASLVDGMAAVRWY